MLHQNSNRFSHYRWWLPLHLADHWIGSSGNCPQRPSIRIRVLGRRQTESDEKKEGEKVGRNPPTPPPPPPTTTKRSTPLTLNAWDKSEEFLAQHQQERGRSLCLPVRTSLRRRQGWKKERGPPFLRMYLWWSLCTLNLFACQVRVTVGDSGLCCCVCVTSFERSITHLCVDSARAIYASFCFERKAENGEQSSCADAADR